NRRRTKILPCTSQEARKCEAIALHSILPRTRIPRKRHLDKPAVLPYHGAAERTEPPTRLLRRRCTMGENNWDILRVIGVVVAAVIGLWLLRLIIVPILGVVLSLLWSLAGLVASLLHIVLFLGLIGGIVY